MANIRPFAFALMGLLAVAMIAPVRAQNNNKPPKPTKAERAAMTKPERKARKAERKAEKRENMMDNNMSGSSGSMAPSKMNNTADVQRNIENANKTLSDMVALLDQIETRKKSGGAQ